MSQDIKIIDTGNKEQFETDIIELLLQGYEIIASNIDFVNREAYDFCDCYQAILLKENQ